MSEAVPHQQSSVADPTAGGARAAPAGPGQARPDDPHRRALADRISEDVLQLLYTARQDLAELSTLDDADPKLVRSAHDCTAGAISILRGLVSTVLTAAWGPPPGVPGTSGDWEPTASILFDALSDAWVITCEKEDLLYASHAACEVLGRSSGEIAELLRGDPDGWPRRLAEEPHHTPAGERIAFTIEVPVDDGGVRRIDVVSHPLPAAPDLEPSYLSLLSPQED